MSPTPHYLSLCAMLVAVLVAAPTFGQGESTTAQEAPSDVVLEEITVTARKTDERLLDAPLSITAFSADDIERKDSPASRMSPAARRACSTRSRAASTLVDTPRRSASAA